MDQASWIPKDVDLTRPSAARTYDFLLGGAHNFASDRDLGRRIIERVPDVKECAVANRTFLRRAVQHCLDQGITQFLDIGSGIPTSGNVHEIARDARVVYVDNEPVAVAHSQSLLQDNDRATIVRADLRNTDEVLCPEALALLDLDQPVAVMMVALLHFVPDSEHPEEILRSYYERMAPGSYLALSHATGDVYPERIGAVIDLYAESTNPLLQRSCGEVEALLADFELVDPGVAHVPEWHPDSPEDIGDDPARSLVYGCVGRKV
jgi:O-methyltransferase involved in polyketide biosynthesis